MACNSWDKLVKAQRDYPKAKFADSFVQKSLKKSPKNPFLLAWKADLSLQLHQDPKNVVLQIQQAWQQPGAYDVRLLAYMYKLLAEATRRHNPTTVYVSGLGNENSKVWLSAAKSMDRRGRQELWSALGKAAFREECWEDFRFAVVQYNKELKDSPVSAPLKKHAHYIQVLATQLSAEQQRQLPDGAMKCQIQFDLARRLMKQAYEASPDEPIACKDIRDLRFMGELFARQDKCDELLDLWNSPPDGLKDLMATHQADLRDLRTRLPRDSKNWSLVESQCLATIENAISQVTENPDSKALWELCAWKNDVWTGLLEALRNNKSVDEGNAVVSDILQRAFGTETQRNDRFLRLTYMLLRQFIGTPMLDNCKTYWENHSTLISCFKDLRPFVEGLENKAEFCDFFVDAKVSGQDNFSDKDWKIHKQNILILTYLLTTLAPNESQNGEADLEKVFTQACESSDIGSPSSPAGYVGIYSLLRMHHEVISKQSSEDVPDSRRLLQAAMLARHLVACDKEKQDRPRALLAARLHLNLALGKSAFQMYSYTKCKEMLVHTLSPFVLSRISLTHPFGAKGYQGFTAEDELGRAIGNMERMDSKTDDTIYPDLSVLPWDQAIALLALKRKFKSSSTKHICNMERRRIARLKGESIEALPVLDQQSFQNITNNVDVSGFPNYENTKTNGPLPYFMPNGVPNVSWILQSYDTWEASTRLLYRETPTWENAGPLIPEAVKNTNDTQAAANLTPAESQAAKVWDHINTIVKTMAGQENNMETLPAVIKALPEDVQAMRAGMEKLRTPVATDVKLEDEPTMFHENMLLSCYATLELLRALVKLADHVREKIVNPKSAHAMKSKLPKNWVGDIESEAKKCFEAVRGVADTYIKRIESKGQAAIKAQVRWGKTGEILKGVLKDDDVEAYAVEYVDGALQGWKGVLQVKLK